MTDFSNSMPDAASSLRTLAAASWQLLIVAAAAAIVCGCLRDRLPRLRHALWVLVLVKCLLPPSLAAPWSPTWPDPVAAVLTTAAGPVADTDAPPTSVATTSVAPVAIVEAVPPKVATRPIDASSIAAPTRVQAAATTPPRSPATPAWTTVVITVWLAGTLAVWLLAVVRSVRLARHISRRSEPFDDGPARAALDEATAALGLRRVRLRRQDIRSTPFVFGLLRPTIVLPHAVTDALPADQQRLIVWHEAMHVRRGDLWIALLATVAAGLFWFHPAVWWAAVRVRLLREPLCDAAVLTATNCEPAHYGETLLSVLRAIQPQPPACPPLALGIFERGLPLRTRLESIMADQPTPRRGLVPAAATLFALAVLPLGSTQADEAATEIETEQPSPNAAPPQGETPSRLNQVIVVDADHLDALSNLPDDPGPYILSAEFEPVIEGQEPLKVQNGSLQQLDDLSLRDLLNGPALTKPKITVDPATSVIRVAFNKPTEAAGRFLLLQRDAFDDPNVMVSSTIDAKKVDWSDDRRTASVHVDLKPDATYELGFSRREAQSFESTDQPAAPIMVTPAVTFRTRPVRKAAANLPPWYTILSFEFERYDKSRAPLRYDYVFPPLLNPPPGVISTSVPVGVKVDPATPTIRVEFDRPVQPDGDFVLMRLDGLNSTRHNPDAATIDPSFVRWSANRRVAFVRVELEPEATYQLAINIAAVRQFRSVEGDLGLPMAMTFGTGPAHSERRTGPSRDWSEVLAMADVPEPSAATPPKTDDPKTLLKATFDNPTKPTDAPEGWTRQKAAGVSLEWRGTKELPTDGGLILKKTKQSFFPIASWKTRLPHTNAAAKSITLSADVQAQKARKAVLDVLFLDANGEWIQHEWAAYIGEKKAGDRSAQHAAKSYSGTVKIPEGTAFIELSVQMYGPGAIAVDNVTAVYGDE